jgi:DNA primase
MPKEPMVSLASMQEAKEQVRRTVDIVDLVGSYLPLQRQGNAYVATCPWHDDARPSLQVNPARQSWKCWVCDIGGDIFNFVMQKEGLDFREALEMLAERAGVDIRGSGAQPKTQPGDPNDKQTLFNATTWAMQQFRECLLHSAEAAPARKYLEQRQFNAEACARFQVGFSPDAWQWLVDRAAATQFSAAVLKSAGLLGTSAKSGRYYDFFKGRVMFPIRDTQNRTIGFGGRVLPEFAQPNTGKYVNSRETRLFSKSETVYGLDLAREAISKSREVVVVEGYTDVIMAHQYGLTNVVAVLGTALGQRHIRLLKRYADTITLVLDGDEAGQRRTNDVLGLFVAGEVDLRILTLPAGADPCDFLLTEGADGMRTLLAGAVDAFEHAIGTHTSGIDLVRDTHRANQALEALLNVVAKAPRLTANTTSSKTVRERQVLARLAREFRVEDSMLRTRIAELRQRAAPLPPADAGPAQPTKHLRAELDPVEVELLEIMAVHPDLCHLALEEIPTDLISSPPIQQIYARYRAVAEMGEAVVFSRILSDLEDPQLKNLFVDIDEQATSKEEEAQEDATTRLRRLLDGILDRQHETSRRELVAGLEQRQFEDQEELDVLKQLHEEERRRQGIPAPTDG